MFARVEAIAATGASEAQILNYGIVPQVMPAFWGISVFRWDINIRESTILGLVGAGGIGLKLQSSLNVLAWPQVTVILLLILATVGLLGMGLGQGTLRDHLTCRYTSQRPKLHRCCENPEGHAPQNASSQVRESRTAALIRPTME